MPRRLPPLTLPLAALLGRLCSSSRRPPARAAHGPDGAGGRYAGFAHGSAVHVDAVTTETMRLADPGVGIATAAVDSRGLRTEILDEHRRPIVPSGIAKLHARGRSSIVEAGVAHAPDADNQLRPFVAESGAPGGGGPVDRSVATVPAGTAAYADPLRNKASAVWNGSTCVLGAPIAFGEQHAARLQVVEMKDDPATDPADGFDQPLLGVDADAPARAATTVSTKEQLFSGSGEGLGLLSVTRATLAPVTLFAGSPQEFTIELDGPAFLAASADGTRGGAAMTYAAPLVSVDQNGEATTVLPERPVTVRVPGTGDAVAEITVLDAAQPELTGVTIALGHMEAAATVPAGGIACPLRVERVADPAAVASGEQFTATITVHNDFACPPTNVEVVDEITTERGARFEVDSTTPQADAVPRGSGLESGTVRWEDLPDIPPGKRIEVAVTVLAQGGAGRINDVATASGNIANCPAGLDEDGVDVGGVVEIDVPAVGEASFTVDASVELGVQLPATGAAAGPAGLAPTGAVARWGLSAHGDGQ